MRLQALSPVLKKELKLEDRCLFNPSFVFIANESQLLISFRIYRERSDVPCVTAGANGGQWWSWLHGGSADIGYGLVLLLRSSASSGRPRATVLDHILVTNSNLEDARLWRDNTGCVRMIFNR